MGGGREGGKGDPHRVDKGREGWEKGNGEEEGVRGAYEVAGSESPGGKDGRASASGFNSAASQTHPRVAPGARVHTCARANKLSQSCSLLAGFAGA